MTLNRRVCSEVWMGGSRRNGMALVGDLESTYSAEEIVLLFSVTLTMSP